MAFYRGRKIKSRIPTAAAMDRDECNRLWTVSQASNPSKLLKTTQEDKEKKNGQSIKECGRAQQEHSIRLLTEERDVYGAKRLSLFLTVPLRRVLLAAMRRAMSTRPFLRLEERQR